MKKSYLLLASLLLVTTLTGCTKGGEKLPETPEEIVSYVLSKLKNNSHELIVDETLQVLRPNDKYAVDIYQNYHYEFGYYYDTNSDKVAKSEKRNGLFADLDKKSHEIIEETSRTSFTPKATYYKDLETGLTKLKQVTLQNELEVLDLAYQESETGTFTPVVYDDEFKNPFDYVTTRDLTYVESDNTISLSKDKATFIATNYDGVGLNLIESASIKLNDKYIPTEINFQFTNTETETFVRKTELTVTITNVNAKYYEVKPYTYNNTTLGSALLEYKDAKNFTYHKDYVYEGESYSHISGFYTEDMVYFHHGYESDGDVYKKGDDYDYVSKKNADDNIFYVYDCTTVDGENWNWGIVMASSEEPLKYNSFEELAPSYFNISPNIFKPLGNNVYECEEELLPTIGQFFDYGMWGVDSFLLESATNKCKITLTNEGHIKLIEVGFHLENFQYDIQFRYENIGTTQIPTWLEFNY